MLLVSLHGAPALAGDIAQNTPAASMALATGLYAAPGQSAAVSTVQTPSVTTSPLPEQAPPASVSVPAPAVIAAAPLASPPATTTGWTNYVTVIASLVGALAGIAGMIMGGLALRRVSRRRRY
jgi:negative regulator of sigma E activity